MISRKILVVAAFIMALGANNVSAQAGSALDPIAGVFRPMPVQVPTSAPRAAASRTGRYEVTIAINVVPAPPTGTKPSCIFTAGHFTPSGIAYQETGTSPATGSASSWSCKVVVPYAWPQAEPAAPVSLSILVSSPTSGTTKTRSHFRSLGPLPVPADKAVTKLSYNVTL